VNVERRAHADAFVRPDLVGELAVGLDLDADVVPVVDLDPLVVLVREQAEGALTYAVLVRIARPRFGVLVTGGRVWHGCSFI